METIFDWLTIDKAKMLGFPLSVCYNDLASVATLWQHRVR